MTLIRVKFCTDGKIANDGKFFVVESYHKNFKDGMIISIGQIRLAVKQGFTITILPE